MDLRFPSVFSEDVTMCTVTDYGCGLRMRITDANYGCGLRMWITIVGSLQAGRGWAMDLRFPSVFSEDVTMRIVGPPG